MEDNIRERQRNLELKTEFEKRELDLYQVWEGTYEDLETQNNQLENLLSWVQQYEKSGNRETMEVIGYTYPPISFGIDPDSDWLRFELWMNKKDIRFKMKDKLPADFKLRNPEELSDEEIEGDLEKIAEFCSLFDLSVEYIGRVPPRLAYEELVSDLHGEFEILCGGVWHLDGCSGDCPSCFQRPWCESGLAICFPQDEEAGQVYFIEALRKYVSPTPFSLQILKQKEKEEGICGDEIE